MDGQPIPPLLSPDAQEIYDRLSKGAGRFASSKTGWATSGPPSNDIAALNANPKLAAEFDGHYGKGSAQKYLGRWAEGGTAEAPPRESVGGGWSIRPLE